LKRSSKRFPHAILRSTGDIQEPGFLAKRACYDGAEKKARGAAWFFYTSKYSSTSPIYIGQGIPRDEPRKGGDRHQSTTEKRGGGLVH